MCWFFFFTLLNAFRKHWQYLHNSTVNFSSYFVQRSNLTIWWIWRRKNSFILDKTDLHQNSQRTRQVLIVVHELCVGRHDYHIILSQMICIYFPMTVFFSSFNGRKNEGKQLEFFLNETNFSRAKGKLHFLSNKKKSQNISNEKKIFYLLAQKSVTSTVFLSFQNISIWSLLW